MLGTVVHAVKALSLEELPHSSASVRSSRAFLPTGKEGTLQGLMFSPALDLDVAGEPTPRSPKTGEHRKRLMSY